MLGFGSREGAELREAHVRRRRLGPVGHHRGDAVALLAAEVGEVLRVLQDELAQLGVRQVLALRVRRRGAGMSAGGWGGWQGRLRFALRLGTSSQLSMHTEPSFCTMSRKVPNSSWWGPPNRQISAILGVQITSAIF